MDGVEGLGWNSLAGSPGSRWSSGGRSKQAARPRGPQVARMPQWRVRDLVPGACLPLPLFFGMPPGCSSCLALGVLGLPLSQELGCLALSWSLGDPRRRHPRAQGCQRYVTVSVSADGDMVSVGCWGHPCLASPSSCPRREGVTAAEKATRGREAPATTWGGTHCHVGRRGP